MYNFFIDVLGSISLIIATIATFVLVFLSDGNGQLNKEQIFCCIIIVTGVLIYWGAILVLRGYE
jgi:hypothetical protein